MHIYLCRTAFMPWNTCDVVKQTQSNPNFDISFILVGNKLVHSDAVGASFVGAVPTTSSFEHLASMDSAESTAGQGWLQRLHEAQIFLCDPIYAS